MTSAATGPGSTSNTVIETDKAKKGDRSAQDHLVRRFTPYVRFNASSCLGALPTRPRGVEIDDLVHDVWCVFFKHFKKFKCDYGARSWLRFLSTIVWRTASRYREKELRSPAIAAQLVDDEGNDPNHDVRARGPGPATLAKAKEVAWLELIFARLSSKEREIAKLGVIQCLSHEEIAEKLGIKVATSRVRLYRAMQSLRAMSVDPVLKELYEDLQRDRDRHGE